VPGRLRITLASAAALAVLLAACGSDGASPAAAPTTTTATVHDDGHGDHGDDRSVAPATPLAVRADGMIDPDRIDLAGIEGVTAEQEANAEDLLRRTILVLPRWSDVEVARAEGFVSIGDDLTGEEHFLRWDWIEDDVMLDPEHPEALVYRVEPDGARTLEAAMFILPEEYTLDNLPDVGGPMVQFHIHDDLCFTDDPVAPQVASLTSVGGTCNPPLVKFNPNVMIHVWIRANPCGPFAALQGVGAGQIREGEERVCTPEHGGELGL
jgi:hypothetical protein